MARQPSPVQRVLALLDPLLGCPATIVESHHSFGASRHVCDDEAHPREQLSNVVHRRAKLSPDLNYRLPLGLPITPTPRELVNHSFCHDAFLKETARRVGTRVDVLDALRREQVPETICEFLCGSECRDQLIRQLTASAAVADASAAAHETCHRYFLREMRELDVLAALQSKQVPAEALKFICGRECHDKLIEKLRGSVTSAADFEYSLSDRDGQRGPRTIEDVLETFKLKQGPLHERIKKLIASIADTPGTELLQLEVTNALKVAVKRPRNPLPKHLLKMASKRFKSARMRRLGTEPLKPLKPVEIPAPLVSEVECRRCGKVPDPLRHRIPQRLRSTDRLLACSLDRRDC